MFKMEEDKYVEDMFGNSSTLSEFLKYSRNVHIEIKRF